MAPYDHHNEMTFRGTYQGINRDIGDVLWGNKKVEEFYSGTREMEVCVCVCLGGGG